MWSKIKIGYSQIPQIVEFIVAILSAIAFLHTGRLIFIVFAILKMIVGVAMTLYYDKCHAKHDKSESATLVAEQGR